MMSVMKHLLVLAAPALTRAVVLNATGPARRPGPKGVDVPEYYTFLEAYESASEKDDDGRACMANLDPENVDKKFSLRCTQFKPTAQIPDPTRYCMVYAGCKTDKEDVPEEHVSVVENTRNNEVALGDAPAHYKRNNSKTRDAVHVALKNNTQCRLQVGVPQELCRVWMRFVDRTPKAKPPIVQLPSAKKDFKGGPVESNLVTLPQLALGAGRKGPPVAPWAKGAAAKGPAPKAKATAKGPAPKAKAEAEAEAEAGAEAKAKAEAAAPAEDAPAEDVDMMEICCSSSESLASSPRLETNDLEETGPSDNEVDKLAEDVQKMRLLADHNDRFLSPPAPVRDCDPAPVRDYHYTCGECGEQPPSGAIDPKDGAWYCKDCWTKLLAEDPDYFE